MDQVAEIIGWVGAIAVLAGYALFSLGWLPNGYLFQLANWAGSTALAFHAFHIESWPSLAINICWSIISAAAMVRLYRRRRSAPETGARPPGDPHPETCTK